MAFSQAMSHGTSFKIQKDSSHQTRRRQRGVTRRWVMETVPKYFEHHPQHERIFAVTVEESPERTCLHCAPCIGSFLRVPQVADCDREEVATNDGIGLGEHSRQGIDASQQLFCLVKDVTKIPTLPISSTSDQASPPLGTFLTQHPLAHCRAHYRRVIFLRSGEAGGSGHASRGT